MKKVERIEVVVDALHAPKVIEVFRRHGLTGWSQIGEVAGFGQRGALESDGITRVKGNRLLITTCDPERLDALAEDLRPLLIRHGGACLVSPASWLKH